MKLIATLLTFNIFDAKQFLKSTTSAAGSTKVEQCNPGEYVAKIDTIDFRQAAAGEKSRTPGAILTFCDISYEIDSAEERQRLGREKVTARQSMIVDLSADGKSLDMARGKNVTLNRVRDAVGQNVDGQEWSPEMLSGKLLRVKVEPQKNNPEYVEVTTVGKL